MKLEDWVKTPTCRTGELYQEWGALLTDPSTTLDELADFGIKHELDIEVRFRVQEQEK